MMRFRKKAIYEIHIPEDGRRFYAFYEKGEKFPTSLIVGEPFHIFRKLTPTTTEGNPPLPHAFWLSERYIKHACIKIRRVEKWEEMLIRVEGIPKIEGKTLLTIRVI